jgi:hypothetical protein
MRYLRRFFRRFLRGREREQQLDLPFHVKASPRRARLLEPRGRTR